MSYTINFTDKRKTPIIIDDTDIDNSTDITLFGRSRLAYGEQLQENLLHILENFSCPEDPDHKGTPDLTKSSPGVFDNITTGQGWYNSTTSTLYYYDGTFWTPMASEQSVAANWGVIADGQYLPKPISAVTSRVFDYPECVYIVSPQMFPQKIDFMVCEANTAGLVTMQYRISGTDEIVSGVANYLIVGIAGNVNQSAPPIGVTPTPTPTPTSSLGNSPTPTPTVTRSVTPVVSLSTTRTPLPTHTRTPAATHTPTPTPSHSVPAPSVLPIQGQTMHAYSVGSGRCPGSTASCSIGMIFNPNGTYSVTAASFPGTNNSGTQNGTWLPPSWAVSDSEIKFTGVVTITDDVGATVTNSATAYQPLTTAQVYSLSASVDCGGGRGKGSSVALTISIKRISTGVTINTTCTLNCDVASGD